MPRPTIASLTADLAAARQAQLDAAKALDAARIRIAELEGDVAALKAQAARAGSATRGAPTRSAYVPAPPSPELVARRALLARAKELAMAGKRCVVRDGELVVFA